VADGQSLPVAWNGEKSENIKWKTRIPGLAHSSPVVWGDRVFITTAISSDPAPTYSSTAGGIDAANDNTKHSWRIYSLDKKTGRILWEKTAYEGIPKVKRHIKATQANSTPVTDGRIVAALFGSEGLYVYDLNGKLLWQADLGILDPGYANDPRYPWGYASSPIIYKDLLIVQCDIQKNSFVAAYNIGDGKRAWMTPREELPSWGTPTIIEGRDRVEMITNSPRHIRGIDPLTGRELWRFFDNAEVKVPSPIIAHGLIYVTGGNPPGRPIYTFRPGGNGDISNKESQASNPQIAWIAPRGGPYTPTPLVYGDYLYICADNGVLTCYNAKTGERIYQQRVGTKGSTFSASPVASDGKLHLASEDGEIYVVKAGPAYELLSTNPMGEALMATPAISGGLLIVRAQNHVFAIAQK